MRYLYVKNGDAVEQVQRVLQAGHKTDPHGPDAFISSLLEGTKQEDMHVLSRGRRRARLEHGVLSAETFDGGTSFFTKLFRRPTFAIKLVQQILTYRPDRILCGSTGSQLLACWISSRIRRTPIVHSRHNRLSKGHFAFLSWLRVTIELFLLKRTDAIVAHGPYLAAQLTNNGIDINRIFEFEVSFPGTVPNRHWSPDPLLLFIGRVEAQKGILDLLNAVQGLFDKHQGLSLEYIGDGTGRENLIAEVCNRQLDSRVHIRGPVPHEDVLDIIGTAVAVITPTRLEFPEGRCMVAMESLAMGVPVVAPDFGPFPFLVKHEFNGLLFDPNNVRDLQDALNRILSDPSFRRQIESGARASASLLRQPQTSFHNAVQRAFSKNAAKQLPQNS